MEINTGYRKVPDEETARYNRLILERRALKEELNARYGATKIES